MLLFAAVCAPQVVGYYAAIVLVYNLVQGWFEGSARLAGVGAVGSVSGERIIAQYRRLLACLGPLFLGGTLAGMYWIGGVGAETILTLAPVILAPLPIAAATRAVIGMQHAGKWKELAKYQSVAVLVSTLIGVPTVLVFRNALGSTVQLLSQQTLWALLVIHAAKKLDAPTTQSEDGVVSYSKQFVQASLMVFVDWVQGQFDRLLIGFLSGASTLGLYNFGWNIARTAPDATSQGLGGVLRSHLLGSTRASASDVRGKVQDAVTKAMTIHVALITVTWLGSYIILPTILGDDWDVALILVPLMCAATVPIAVSQCFTQVLVWQDKLHVGVQSRVVGCIFAVAVALSSLISLQTAVWVAIVREVAIMLFLWRSTRELVGGAVLRVPLLLCGALAAGGALFALTYPVLSGLFG